MKNNDKTLLKIGFFLLLVFIFYSYNGQSFIALLEKVGGLGEIKADADVAKNIAVITHVFMISVIAMFIGTPLSRTLNAIIIKNSHRYNLIKIPQLNKRASKEWSKVVDVLEHHQYTPLLVKLRQLGIQDKFEISTENSFTILPSFLHRASDLLFRIVDSLDEIISRDKNDRKILINYQKTITILRKEVRRLRYKNEIVKSLLLFVVILFPFCIALLIFGLCELPLSAENYRRECKLVIGVGLIFLSYPSALLFHYVIGFISAKIWRGESTVYDDFIFNVYSFIFSSVVFSAIVYSGVSYLAEIK